MCIAIYKPKDAQFPSKETLRTCYQNNPDGAGFAYSEGDAVVIRKGYFDFESFYGALKKAKKKSKTGDFLLHFRISTQGGINPENCHPFPLSSKTEDLKKRFVRSDYAIIHNGIIPLTSTYDNSYFYYGNKSGSFERNKYSPSDTALFVRDYLTLIINGPNYWKDRNKRELITRLIESKMAILHKNGHCELFGAGWEQDNGVWYSNETYKKPKYFIPANYSTGYGSLNSAKKESKSFSLSKKEEEEIIADEYDDYNNWEMYGVYLGAEKFYDFDSIDCPLAVDGDDSYCHECMSYSACFCDCDGKYERFLNETYKII